MGRCRRVHASGCDGLQVCTAVMHRGFGVIKSMTRGLEQWMEQKGFESIDQIVGPGDAAHQALGQI